MATPESEASADDATAFESGSRVRFAPPQAEAVAVASNAIGGRYVLLDELGRGGMGVVYRVHDTGSGRELALKQLLVRVDDSRHERAIGLFEREFHTLAQLAHPRVITVYDYALDPAGPFYTMELLDGGDLKALAPLEVTRACRLMLEVCSSLALLHSRRLVHRDISPRNIRCTRDGHAKLIDFGAMVPMGLCSHTVGTPAFVAPEVVHRLNLDARTDLFSLGATLYYALTGRSAFAVNKLSDLREAWSAELVPPSRYVTGIPPALDALCASLLRIDPGQRPRSAFEVMQRLEAIAGIENSEPLDVSRAYLSTPVLIGREAELRTFRQRMRRALHGSGSGLLIEGGPGLGRSRLLDACVLEAKTLGATVLRAGGTSAEAPFALARRVCEQLLQALPEAALQAAERASVRALLFDATSVDRSAPCLLAFDDAGLDRAALQTALSRWLREASSTHALLIAVDDVASIDEVSVAWLAGLALKAAERRLMLVVSSEPAALERGSEACSILGGHCTRVGLRALSHEQTEALLESVFGNVPHLQLLADRIYKVALGNPRESLALAQDLVDAGRIRYEDAQWTLPSELESRDLPASAAEAFAARAAALPPLARRLAEAHALIGDAVLGREDYASLAGEQDAQQLDAALDALISHEVIKGDGQVYRLCRGGLATSLRDALDPDQKRERHLAIYELFARQRGTHPYLLAQHLLAAERYEQTLDLLLACGEMLDQNNVDAARRADPQHLCATLERALELSESFGRPPREAHEMRRRLCTLALSTDDAVHARVAPAWLAQLELDAGLRDYRALDPALDPGTRLQQALGAAAARHAALSEAQRVYRVDEAIKLLAVYVVTTMVVGTRALDLRLLTSLPPLLEPFAALSPALYALWQNALGLNEGLFLGRRLQARQRWADVHEHLAQVPSDAVRYVDDIRTAVALGIGRFEAMQGRAAAAEWADMLDKDPMYRVSAMHMRRIARMMRGDTEGAERFAMRAELLALQSSARQMFDKPWQIELAAHVLARDLGGVKQMIDGIAPLAARYPGWQPQLATAEGHFQALRGDFAAAAQAFERCMALASPDDDAQISIEVWTDAVAGLVAARTELGDADAAIELGERALEICAAREVTLSWHKLACVLALAEATAGRLECAAERIDALLLEQEAFGTRGLILATSHEARARIAIWARDAAVAARHAALAVRERGGPTAAGAGARVERLLEEARGAGLEVVLEQTEFEASVFGTTRSALFDPHAAHVSQTLAECTNAAERAERALGVLCEVMRSPAGHLYLIGPDAQLALAASLDAPSPDAELMRFARSFFARQVDEDEARSAGLTEATQMLALPGAASFVDSQGVERRLLMLTCKHDGALVYVGLAVVAVNQGHRLEPDTLLYGTALAAHLLRAGDTQGRR